MAYRVDLAHIHDDGFGDYARNAAPGILQLLKDAGIESGHVVDLGCGSGILARRLLDAGYFVTGIELSEAMIDLAVRRAPGAKYVRASFLDAEIPSCDAVTSTGECLCYLIDHRNDLDALERLFRRIYAALRPGGLFIFDACVEGRSREQTSAAFAGDDWSLVTEYSIDTAAKVLTRTMTIERRIDGETRRDREVHKVRLYDEGEVRQRLAGCGFDVRTERTYGDFQLYEGIVVFIAAKLRHGGDGDGANGPSMP